MENRSELVIENYNLKKTLNIFNFMVNRRLEPKSYKTSLPKGNVQVFHKHVFPNSAPLCENKIGMVSDTAPPTMNM